MDITQQIGLSTELHCILDLTNLGIRCLTPVDDSSKYDVVADIDGKFIRIQCKSSKWARNVAHNNEAFEFSTIRMTINTKKATRYKYNANEIDYFYTWFNGQGYLVSVDEAQGTQFRLRYEYPSNNQKEGIHLAENYKIEGVLKVI